MEELATASLATRGLAVLAARGVRLQMPSRVDGLSPGVIGPSSGPPVSILRDDLLSPLFPGNKLRKLLPHIAAIDRHRPDRVLTFSGAYSNHLYAFASACHTVGFRATGLIRGERIEPLNPVLKYAERAGVELVFIDRETYERRRDNDFLEELKKQFGHYYLVPEGGTDRKAVASVAEVGSEIPQDVTVVVTAVGTGGTLAGLALALANRAGRAVGIAVLRAPSLDAEVRALVPATIRNWHIEHGYSFGGFARTTPELWTFANGFERRVGIGLDLVYTAKALYGLDDLLRRGALSTSERILFVHTGGVPIDTRSDLLQSSR